MQLASLNSKHRLAILVPCFLAGFSRSVSAAANRREDDEMLWLWCRPSGGEHSIGISLSWSTHVCVCVCACTSVNPVVGSWEGHVREGCRREGTPKMIKRQAYIRSRMTPASGVDQSSLSLRWLSPPIAMASRCCPVNECFLDTVHTIWKSSIRQFKPSDIQKFDKFARSPKRSWINL